MPDTFVKGMDAKLYYHATATGAGVTLASMTEITNVRDVTINTSAGEADTTTRGNSGWRSTTPTLRELTIEFEMQHQPGDVAFETIRDAYLAGTAIELCALTGPEGVENPNSEGPKGTFVITNFSRSEPLEESVSVSVTAKLQTFDEWIDDGVGTGS